VPVVNKLTQIYLSSRLLKTSLAWSFSAKAHSRHCYRDWGAVLNTWHTSLQAVICNGY